MSGTTVILGAGIIGCSTAFYLSESKTIQPQNIHLVDPLPDLFQCASGLAAGFLAADWFAPSVSSLGALSFRLHKELAEKHGGREKWGYCRSTGTSLSQETDVAGHRGDDWLRAEPTRTLPESGHEQQSGKGPVWLTKRKGSSIEVISGHDSTGQIDPLRLCRFLLKHCKDRGVQVHHPAKAISVLKDSKNQLASIRIVRDDGSEADIPCARILIASGAWSPKVFSTLFPLSPVRLPLTSLAGHSLVLRSPRWSAAHEDTGCHAVFATDTLGFSPEIFSRTGGEIYVAGLNNASLELPELSSDAKINEDAIAQLKDVGKRMLGLEDGTDDLEVLREGLCFRPVTPSGRPILSRIPDSKLGNGFSTAGAGKGGIFLAAGHGPWGISQCLGTGKVMAEMLEGLPTSADIDGLVLR
ncbi:FAD dependent oxidoreductase-like protein superfamily [Patellaria atrata CBS 101060]|uniref:FAD dependent oxidoreductase-like protein superfamily n=1 Tax=Patellaria atrata CBS 101060 TaxID=1346257 RepID=A0A9P4SIS1_9PEZI|nr:FAD dependent oxidoreductase-like protein superfamily [Patellaria atrata CBS 101060]